MSDLTDSIKEIFNERISSPFYGSLIVSWLLWNWKIPYVTFFVDQSRLGDAINKIDYIFEYCDSPWNLLVFPLLSTALILLGMPYITNGASWITERFDTWRVNKKNEVQCKRLLTVEESLQLRIKIRNQEEEFTKLFAERDEEIKSLKEQLALASKKPKNTILQPVKPILDQDEIFTLLNNPNIKEYYEQIVQRTQNNANMGTIPNKAVQLCLAYDLISTQPKTAGGYYNLTEKGKLFLKEFLTRKT